MWSRRDALKLALFACISLRGTKHALAQTDPRPRAGAPAGPRYVLSILLSGGIDAITTTDPKTRAELAPMVDLPYGKHDIVDTGGMLLGPHFRALAPHARRMAILNGVAVRTANHNTGRDQFLRMTTGVRPTMPTLLDLIGTHRDGQPVGCMSWSYDDAPMRRLFDQTSPDEMKKIAATLRAQSSDVREASARVATNTLDAAALLEHVARVAPVAIETWSEDKDAQLAAKSLQRVLWAFENDLTRCYELNVGGVDQPWDTHTFNSERQNKLVPTFPVLARFLTELEARRANGKIIGDVLVVIGSEIGRFPALNTQHGKDHFPEAPLLFYGAGIRAGDGKGQTYGRTGKLMQALPISLRNGRDTTVDGHMVSIDDVGATLLHITGVVDRVRHGYTGNVLDFLVDA